MENIIGEEIPDTLYKYMSWKVDGKTGINYTKELLENNQFYLSPVDQLNDPFECVVIPSVEATPEDARKRFEKFSRLPELNDIDYENLKEEFASNINYRKCSMQLKHRKERIDTGICCFAGSAHAESLMWSHYADNHKGVCLLFDATSLQLDKNNAKLNILKVDYPEMYPQVNFISDDLWKIVKAKFSTKESCWEYEVEYRVIAIEAAQTYNRKYPFPPKSLVKVILGCNMNISDQFMFTETLKKRSFPVKLYQSTKKEQEFGLEKKYIGTYGG